MTQRAPQRLGWLAPTLRGYDRAWLRQDLVAGVTTGTVVIPQAMAYATLAGLPLQAGLYTCMLPMVVYALLGGSRSLSVSTTSTIAVLVATTLAGLDTDGGATALGHAATLTLLVGVFLLLARLLRLGALVENISHATLTGIKAGVGLTVAATQLPKLLGVPADPDASGFFPVLLAALRAVPAANAATVALSAALIVGLLLLGRFAPRAPAPLLAVAAGIVTIAVTGLADRGVALIDPVPTGIPVPALPSLAGAVALLPGALAIAMMAFLETVAVARGVRRADEPQIDSDQELLAVGVATVAGSFTQTLPPAGGFSQTAVNQRSGARTQVATLVTAGLAVLVALFLAPVLADLPQAVLGVLVVVATLGLIDLSEFGRLRRIDPTEFRVAVVATLVGLTVGLLAAVGVGVLLTLFLVLRELNRARVSPLYRRPEGGWTPNPPDPVPTPPPGVLVLHQDGGLYTGNAATTMRAVLSAVRATEPPVRALVIEGATIRLVTVTLLDTLRELQRELAHDGVALHLASLSPAASEAARRSHWFAEFAAAGHVHDTIDEAVAAVTAGQRPRSGKG